jgi:hypothetical protein
MADALKLCMTDGNGFTLFDYRFLNRIGNGQNFYVRGVLDMVSQTRAASDSQGGFISALYINGHGRPGYQAVGSGTGSDDSGDYSLQTDDKGNLIGAASYALANLITYFTDDAMITLSGCEVAAGWQGKFLLRAVAQATGVWVQAADAKQFAWIPGWEGSVYKASPSGDILCPDGDYM